MRKIKMKIEMDIAKGICYLEMANFLFRTIAIVFTYFTQIVHFINIFKESERKIQNRSLSYMDKTKILQVQNITLFVMA